MMFMLLSLNVDVNIVDFTNFSEKIVVKLRIVCHDVAMTLRNKSSQHLTSNFKFRHPMHANVV